MQRHTKIYLVSTKQANC